MTASTDLGPAGRPFVEPTVFGEGSLERTPTVVDRGAIVLVFLALAGLALGVGLFVGLGEPVVAVSAALGLPVLATIVRYPFAAILLWVGVMPFFIQTETITPHPAFWILHRMMIPAALGLVLVYHGLGQIRSKLRFTTADVAILLFLGIGVANVLLLSDNPARMIVAFYDRLAVPMLAFWLIRALHPTQRDLQRLALTGAILVLVQAAIGILSLSAPGLLPEAWLGRAGERTVGSFGAPGPFTVTLVFFSLLAAHYALAGSGRRPRLFLLAALAAGLFAVFISFQRGGWLGAAVGFSALAVVHSRATARLAIAAILVGVVLALGPLAAEFQFATERLQEGSTINARLVTFDAAVQMVEDRPATGFGYGQFEKFDEQYKRSLGDIGLTEGGSLHNAWLGLAAENGIPSVVIYAIPALYLFLRTLRARGRVSRSGFMGGAMLIIVWGAVLDIFVVSNTMDMLHSSAWGTMLAWIGLGLIAVQLDQLPDRVQRTSSRVLDRLALPHARRAVR
jgi:O-antigen ligase